MKLVLATVDTMQLSLPSQKKNLETPLQVKGNMTVLKVVQGLEAAQ